MATLTTGARDAACNAIVDLIDVGTTDANGDLQFQTAGAVAVATLQFANPAFGASATGVAALGAAMTSDTNAAGGTTTQAVFRNRDNAAVLTATVAVSGSDISLSSTTIGAGDTVSVSALTVTMPIS